MINDIVYLLMSGDFHKIGMSSKVKLQARIRALHAANKLGVKLLKTFETKNARQQELAIHKELVQYCIHGEWFKLPDSLKNDLSWFKEKDLTLKPKQQGGSNNRLDVRLPNEFVELLEQRCVETGMTKTEMIKALILLLPDIDNLLNIEI